MPLHAGAAGRGTRPRATNNGAAGRRSRPRATDNKAFSAARCFIALAITHVILWTLAASMGFASPPLDVVENLLWGREWLLGTHKHPPLQAWLTEIAWQTGGMPAIYALAGFCVAATAAAIFLMGRGVAGEMRGFLAALIFLLSFYATAALPELNANIVSMPFWAFAGYFLWRLLLRDGGMAEWLGLALCIAAAFYAKYSVVFLLAGLCAATLRLPQGRRIFRRPMFYAAACIAILLAMPNLIWLVENDFAPLHYATGRADTLHGLARITKPLEFIIGVLLAFALPMLLLAISGARPARADVSRREDLRFIHLLAAVPLAAMVLMAGIGGAGLKSMWGASAAVWLPLVAALHVSPPAKWPRIRVGGAMTAMLIVILPLAAAGYSRISADSHTPQRTAWPGAELTSAALAGWHENIPHAPPPEIIIGPTWEAGLVARFAAHRPSVLIDADYAKSPWVLPDDVAAKGALVVWTGKAQPYAGLGITSPGGEIPLWHKGKKTHFRWAVLPPATQ